MPINVGLTLATEELKFDNPICREGPKIILYSIGISCRRQANQEQAKQAKQALIVVIIIQLAPS